MHRLGTVLASSHHEDELRRAALLRRVRPQPDLASASVATEPKPTLRHRVASAFRPQPIRPAGA
jgi:hypothetical protein